MPTMPLDADGEVVDQRGIHPERPEVEGPDV